MAQALDLVLREIQKAHESYRASSSIFTRTETSDEVSRVTLYALWGDFAPQTIYGVSRSNAARGKGPKNKSTRATRLRRDVSPEGVIRELLDAHSQAREGSSISERVNQAVSDIVFDPDSTYSFVAHNAPHAFVQGIRSPTFRTKLEAALKADFPQATSWQLSDFRYGVDVAMGQNLLDTGPSTAGELMMLLILASLLGPRNHVAQDEFADPRGRVKTTFASTYGGIQVPEGPRLIPVVFANESLSSWHVLIGEEVRFSPKARVIFGRGIAALGHNTGRVRGVNFSFTGIPVRNRPEVSTFHAQLSMNSSQSWEIFDCGRDFISGSTYGTLLVRNGNMLQVPKGGRLPLLNGDVIFLAPSSKAQVRPNEYAYRFED